MNPSENGEHNHMNGTHHINSRGQPNGQPHQNGLRVGYERARHPEYADKSKRLFSFTFWRSSHIQDPTNLANIGFFYTGEKDLVRCFYCSIGLKDFIKSDDPLTEHIRYSSNCDFLIQLFGPSRLRELKERINQNVPINSHELKGRFSPITGQTQVSPNGIVQSTSSEIPRHRHPEYSEYPVRVASFTSWPRHLVQTPSQVAEAGFYYTGTQDVVRCFSCDGGLERWDPNDDPWIDHCVNFPTCQFLKETKGEDYITLALAHRERMNGPLAANGIPGHHQNGHAPDNANRETETTKNQLKEMGYSLEDIEKTFKILTIENKTITVEGVIDEIEKSEKVEELDPKDVVEEHKRLKAEMFCMVCKTADTNILFLPCQHHRTCDACAKNLVTCPFCGTKITQKIKTYRS